MASPAPKLTPSDLAKALADFAAKGKPITKVETGAASNVKKSKYIGKKALAGVTQRIGFISSAYCS